MKNLVEKVEIHAFRGVIWSVTWLVGPTRLDVSCQVPQLQRTLPASDFCVKISQFSRNIFLSFVVTLLNKSCLAG